MTREFIDSVLYDLEDDARELVLETRTDLAMSRHLALQEARRIVAREPALMRVVEAAKAYHALMESPEVQGALLVGAMHGAGTCSAAEAAEGQRVRDAMTAVLRALDEVGQ